MSRTLGIEDRLEIHELAARYGNVLDRYNWDDLDLVFTEDAVLELWTPEGMAHRVTGLAAIKERIAVTLHGLVTHHVTNVEVGVDDDGVSLFFKIAGFGPRGHGGSADYRDMVRKEADGWRISLHRVQIRKPETQQTA
jgi:SnoaL-like domain